MRQVARVAKTTLVFAAAFLVVCPAEFDSAAAASEEALPPLNVDDELCLLQRNQELSRSSLRSWREDTVQSGTAAAATAEDLAAFVEDAEAAEGAAADAAAAEKAAAEKAAAEKAAAEKAAASASSGQASGESEVGTRPSSKESDSKDAALPKRSKMVLLALEFCPVTWMLGIDRLYLGGYRLGILKFVLCICTCGVGGVLWGLADFVAVTVNALRRETSIDRLGIHAEFGDEELEWAFWLAVVDILFAPCLIALTRSILQWRAAGRRQLVLQEKERKDAAKSAASPAGTPMVGPITT